MRYSKRSAYKSEIIIAWIMGALAFCFFMGQDSRHLGTWLRAIFPGAILCGQLCDGVVAWATASEEMVEAQPPRREKVESRTKS